MMRWWRSLMCLFRSHCSLFEGDDFTAWVEEQGRESRQSREQLVLKRNFLEREFVRKPPEPKP